MLAIQAIKKQQNTNFNAISSISNSGFNTSKSPLTMHSMLNWAWNRRHFKSFVLPCPQNLYQQTPHHVCSLRPQIWITILKTSNDRIYWWLFLLGIVSSAYLSTQHWVCSLRNIDWIVSRILSSFILIIKVLTRAIDSVLCCSHTKEMCSFPANWALHSIF